MFQKNPKHKANLRSRASEFLGNIQTKRGLTVTKRFSSSTTPLVRIVRIFLGLRYGLGPLVHLHRDPWSPETTAWLASLTEQNWDKNLNVPKMLQQLQAQLEKFSATGTLHHCCSMHWNLRTSTTPLAGPRTNQRGKSKMKESLLLCITKALRNNESCYQNAY